MKELAEHAPAIIAEAAKSPLGILALLCLLLAVLTYLFFRRSSDKIKIVIFIPLFCGVCGFAFAVLQSPVGLAPKNAKPIESSPVATERDEEGASLLKWYVVVASVRSVEEATEKVTEAKSKGFENASYLLQPQSKYIAVIVGKNLSSDDANTLLLKAQLARLSGGNPYRWPYREE